MKYKVFCFGGAGGNIATTLLTNGIPNENIYIFNTDEQGLGSSILKNKFCIGKGLTSGLGAGAVPIVGANAFDEDRELFYKLIKDDCLYIVTGGFGGGNFTGMGPKISELLNSSKKKFIVIGTFPFSFEGRKRKQNSEDAISKIQNYCENLIILKNDHLRSIFGSITIGEAFNKSDYVVLEVIKELIFELETSKITIKDHVPFHEDVAQIILKIKKYLREDEVISLVSSKIIVVDSNKDLLQALNINPDIIYTISPRKFEELIAYIYRLSGYRIELTQQTRDDGADILVWSPPPILGNSFLTIVQAKKYNKYKKVGSGDIRELNGTKFIFNAEKAQIITTSDFSQPAINTAKKCKIDLIKFWELNEKIRKMIN
jgi:cell division protein FtsZ